MKIHKLLTTMWVLSAIILRSNAPAQQRELIFGTVINNRGAPIPLARIKAIATGIDTIVRADDRGRFSLVLVHGTNRVTASMIGYTPVERDVNVSANNARLDFTLTPSAQTLATVQVRDDWIGIRGVVGDESTMKPLAGVSIRSVHRSVDVVTDSAGRFEFALPKAEATALMVTQNGFLSKPVSVAMDNKNSEDVVILMSPGVDPKYMKFAMIDLDHRMAWGGTGMFVASREQMSRYGAKTLGDGIRESGMLTRKGIELRKICLFVNGEPKPHVSPDLIRMADVDFVEVWGENRDETRSLEARWPNRDCKSNENTSSLADARGNQKVKARIVTHGGGPWISVWLRHQ